MIADAWHILRPDRHGLLVDIRFIGKHEPVWGLKIKYPQVDLR